MRQIFLLPVIVSSVLFSSFASAQAFGASGGFGQEGQQPPPPQHRDHDSGLLPEGLFALSLTSAQISSLQTIVSANMGDWQVLSDEVRLSQNNLDDAINLDTFTETTVRDAAKNLEATQEEQFVLKAKVTASIRALLTVAQKNKLDAMRTAHNMNDAEGSSSSSSSVDSTSDSTSDDVTE